MSQQSTLESNINTLRDYAQNHNDPSILINNIRELITRYDSIKHLGEQDVNRNKNMNELDEAVSKIMTENNIGPVSRDGGRRRKSTSSSSRPRRRSSKKRGTQRKQKRRQRRGSRRA